MKENILNKIDDIYETLFKNFYDKVSILTYNEIIISEFCKSCFSLNYLELKEDFNELKELFKSYFYNEKDKEENKLMYYINEKDKEENKLMYYILDNINSFINRIEVICENTDILDNIKNIDIYCNDSFDLNKYVFASIIKDNNIFIFNFENINDKKIIFEIFHDFISLLGSYFNICKFNREKEKERNYDEINKDIIKKLFITFPKHLNNIYKNEIFEKDNSELTSYEVLLLKVFHEKMIYSKNEYLYSREVTNLNEIFNDKFYFDNLNLLIYYKLVNIITYDNIIEKLLKEIKFFDYKNKDIEKLFENAIQYAFENLNYKGLNFDNNIKTLANNKVTDLVVNNFIFKFLLYINENLILKLNKNNLINSIKLKLENKEFNNNELRNFINKGNKILKELK